MKSKSKRLFIKNGMALPIVLVFAFVMGGVSMFLIKTAKNTNAQTQLSMDQLQSYFVARAGAEHIALKVKYLNSNLYDAFCIQQGRNPYFNFSLIKQSDLDNPWNSINEYNPGPIFLYKQNESIHRDRLYSDMSSKPSYSLWVNSFKNDLKDNNVTGHMPQKFKEEIRNKNFFSKATYELTRLDLAASQLTKIAANGGNPEIIKNEMIIEFNVESSILSAKNTPPDGQGNGNDTETFNYQIRKTLKITKEH